MIPHSKFSFAKIWLLAAQFEIRQLNLKGARQILGNAIGRAPKDKVMCRNFSSLFLKFISFVGGFILLLYLITDIQEVYRDRAATGKYRSMP